MYVQYVCMYSMYVVCMYVQYVCSMYVCTVCMYCVRSNLPPHTLESQKRDTSQYEKHSTDFTKNASFKSYGVICSPRAAAAA